MEFNDAKQKLSAAEINLLFYPEITMRQLGETAFNAMLGSIKGKIKLPSMAGTQAVGSNKLGQTATTLWQSVAQQYIDAATKKYAALDTLTRGVRNEIVIEGAGVRPIVHVPVELGAGEAVLNPTDWETSALENTYVPVECDLVSRSGGLSWYDQYNNERFEDKLGSMIESCIAGVFKQFCACVAGALPTSLTSTTAPVGSTPDAAGKIGVFVFDPATWGPETVARQISPLFGEYGEVEELILTPDTLAPLVPVNALSLNYNTAGTYGIGRISSTAGLAGAVTGNKCAGLALRRNGIVMATGVPKMYGPLNAIATRPLGSVAGIPLQLTTWENPGKRTVYNAVEALVGFKVANPLSVYALVAADEEMGASSL